MQVDPSNATQACVASVALSGDRPGAERRAALCDLANGPVQVLFPADLVNEGVDLPAVDTLLL